MKKVRWRQENRKAMLIRLRGKSIFHPQTTRIPPIKTRILKCSKELVLSFLIRLTLIYPIFLRYPVGTAASKAG